MAHPTADTARCSKIARTVAHRPRSGEEVVVRAGRGRSARLRAVVVGALAVALLGTSPTTSSSAAEPSWTAVSTILSGGEPTSFLTALSTDGTSGFLWSTDFPAITTSIVRRTPAGWSTPYVVANPLVRVGVSADGRTAVIAWPDDNGGLPYRVMMSMSVDGSPWSTPDSVGFMGTYAAPGVWVSGDGGTAIVSYLPAGDGSATSSVWTRADDQWIYGGPGAMPTHVLALDDTGASGLGLTLLGATGSRTLQAARWNGSGLVAPQELMPAGWVYAESGGSVRGLVSADGSRMVAAWDAVSTDPGSPAAAVFTAVYENGAWGAAQQRGVSGARLSGSKDLSVITVGARDGGAGGATVVERVNGTWGAPHTLPGGEAVSWLGVSTSDDGSALLLTYSSAARGYRSQLRSGGAWGAEQVIDGQAGGTIQSSALSGDGQHAIAMWRGSGCPTACAKAAALNPLSVPLATGPTVTGAVRVGSTATCSVTWTGATTSSRQWLRNGTAIPGATAATYRPAASDLGRTLSCRVTATNTWGTATRTSAGKAVALGAPLAVVTAPKVAGKPRVGKKLTARTGTWTPGATAYRFQWLNNGKAIKGATKSTYAVKRGDRKDRISVRVTATRTAYSSGVRTTAAVRIG
jgi:hypothetical protein